MLREMCTLAAHCDDVKLSQNYNLTVFSGFFSELFVKRDTIQSNIQFSTEPARTVVICKIMYIVWYMSHVSYI